jgi:hypothetical protein
MLLLTVKGASIYESLEPRATFYITHSKKYAKHEAFSVMIKNYLIQAAIWATSNQLRQLFMTMLLNVR